jgi:hypothetical protein
MLGIHDGGVSRSDPKEVGVKAIHVIENPSSRHVLRVSQRMEIDTPSTQLPGV